LPPYRWGGAEDLVHDTSGWLGAIEGAPTTLGNLLFTASGLIWQFLMWMVRIGVTFGAKIWDFLSLPAAQLTALFGGQLFPLSAAVLVVIAFSGFKNAFMKDSSKSMLMSLIKLGRGWIIPFLLLALLVTNSRAAVAEADKITNADDKKESQQKNDKVKSQAWTIPWIAHTTESITSKFATSLSELDTDNFMEDFTSKDEDKDRDGNGISDPIYDCADYIRAIYAGYLGNEPDAAHYTMVSISKLWVKTHYDNVIRGQFGTTQRGTAKANGDYATVMYDLPGIVGCRAYESWNKTPIDVQSNLTDISFSQSTGKSGNQKSGIIKNAEVFGPHPDSAEFVAAMTAWAACEPTGTNPSPRTPYAFVDHVGTNTGDVDFCKKFFTDTDYNYPGGTGDRRFRGNRKEVNIYIFGEDSHILDILTKDAGCKDGDVGNCSQEVLKVVRPAEELAKSMSGSGWTRVIYGFMSLIVALIAMWVLGPMSVGLLITLFMSIGLLTVGLPAALLLSAAGKPDKARPLYRSIMSSLFAKAMFLFLITVTLLLVTLLNSLIVILESYLSNGLNSLIGALLYGVVPLLAFFVVNFMLKKVMPNANLSNPISTAGMAFKGSQEGWGADNFKNKWTRKGKYDKDGNPIKKEPRPGSLADKLQKSRLGQKAAIMKAQADQAVPSYKRIKTWSRLGNADELYMADVDKIEQMKSAWEDTNEKRKVKRRFYREARDNKKNKKVSQDEGLLNKPGAELDADAVEKGAKKTKTPATASPDDHKTNAKANANALDLEVKKYKQAHPDCSMEEALEAVQKAGKGPVVSKEERDTRKVMNGKKAGYVDKKGNVNAAAIAKNYRATDDGKVVHLGNVLDNTDVKDLDEDALWSRVIEGGAAFGLGKDVLDAKLIRIAEGDGPDSYRFETDAEVAARINATLLSRGLMDTEGRHVNPMDVLGVSKNELHEYVNTGSTGKKDLDDALKDYMNGESKLFESSDAKYEAKQIMVAQTVESERTAEVVKVGLTVANKKFASEQVSVLLSGPEYQEAQEKAALKLVVSLGHVTDISEVDGLVNNAINECIREAETAGTRVPDELMDALKAQMRNNAHETVIKAAKEAAGQFNPALVKALEGLSQSVLVSGATSAIPTLPPLTDTAIGDNVSNTLLLTRQAHDLDRVALDATDSAERGRLAKRAAEHATQVRALRTQMDAQLSAITAGYRRELEEVGRTMYAAAEHECALMLSKFDAKHLAIMNEVDDLYKQLDVAIAALPPVPAPLVFDPTMDPTTPEAEARRDRHDAEVKDRNSKLAAVEAKQKLVEQKLQAIANPLNPAEAWKEERDTRSAGTSSRPTKASSGHRTAGIPLPPPTL